MLGHDYFGGCHLGGSIGWEHDVFPGVQAVHSLCLNALHNWYSCCWASS